MEHAKIHLYHGTGKGKTTAAIGLSIRAAGAGKTIVFAQFMKGNDSSEMNILRTIPQIVVVQVGHQYGFTWNMDEEGKKKIKARHDTMLTEIEKILQEKRVDVLILDEVVSAYQYDLIDRGRVEKLVQNTYDVEMVMTGRNPAEFMIQKADYVTNMQAEKHPYEQGVPARFGIEW